MALSLLSALWEMATDDADDPVVTYMQYMEDTFGTGSTFRSGGTWTFQGNPDGSEVSVP